MKTIIKIALIIFLIIGVTYIGSCVYYNVKAMDSNPLKIPDQEQADYSIKIKNTGLKYYSDEVYDDGNTVTMHGYWQFDGEKYKFVDDDSPPLDRGIFGPIEVRRRN